MKARVAAGEGADFTPPLGEKRLVLHSCCAPCSSAILASLVQHQISPLVFYYNPNIYPQEEYERRKEENRRYAQYLGLEFFDADYEHEDWKTETWELRNEAERGGRCLLCFKLRLARTAQFAHQKGIAVFSTTLSSSPLKRLDQIEEAGRHAEALYPGLAFWARNWRKGGLVQLQGEISRQQGFYRQNYCGCEYSLRS